MKIFTRHGLFPSLFGLTMLMMAAATQAEAADETLNWIMSGDSPSLDRSSKLLFKGNLSGGIKYAEKALARSQSPTTQVLARHNLCLAFLAQNEPARAREHCLALQQAAIPELALKALKPGLYKLMQHKRSSASGPQLQTLVAANLSARGVEANLSQLAHK